MDVDVLVIGGGIAGLWTLDHLRRLGYRVLLVENQALGTGQTVSSQGIIHGGLKYSLRGMLTASADEIREMPIVWRECLSGQREPNLSRTSVRSHCCYLWQTSDLASQAGMLGAQLQLRVKPQSVSTFQRPELLQRSPGQVFRLDEQVLSPTSLLECFRERNEANLLQVDRDNGLVWERKDTISPQITLRCESREMTVSPRAVVMTAGAGNSELTQAAGKFQPMQRRGLHMVLMQGRFPLFQGHCIDGAKTRLTVTSEVVSSDETVWQLGGQIAEQGVKQTPEELIAFAAAELRATLPDLEISEAKFATYHVDRAEKKSPLGLRPDSPQVLRHQNLITCWPTKLAFAPRVAEMIEQMLRKDLQLMPDQQTVSVAADWPRPAVAAPPWSQARQWYRVESGVAVPVGQEHLGQKAA